MNNKIDNKLAFNIYVWVNLSIYVLVLGYLLFFSLAFKNNDRSLINRLIEYILIGPLLVVISQLFEYFIQPAYFEYQILYDEIRFKSYNPNRNNRFRFFLIIFYKRHLIEQTISKQTYNNYTIKFDRFGFRKNLILQKLENGNLYQSKPINISFLSIKKYTDFILSIDRLRDKINLN